LQTGEGTEVSAFMVGTDHIDALLTAGLAEKDNGTLRWEGDGGLGLTDATAGRVGQCCSPRTGAV
jgi:hypothetical protein